MVRIKLFAVCAVLVVAKGSTETCEFQPVPTPKPVNCTQLQDELGPETQQEYGRVARKMCRKHQQDFCDLPAKYGYGNSCGSSGELADILEFPHMALLGYGDGDSREFSCGGSLISPTFVLTAAHCRTGLENKPMRVVVLGSTNRTQSTNAGDTRQEIPVAEVIAHPEYRPPAKYNDIALVRLARPAMLSALNVRPACLHTDMDPSYLTEEAVATGWGATGWGEDASETLIKVNLTVRNMHYCADSIQLDPEQSPRGLLASTQLCAGGGSHGRDTCQGDSGGPLQVWADPWNRFPCLHRIIGVVSFGPFCGLGKPGIYTKVTGFIPWIESVVWPSETDTCARGTPFKNGQPTNRTLLVPNTAPGTVARRMCRAYHVDFCPLFNARGRVLSPGITPKTRCHHNRPKSELIPRSTGSTSISTGILKYGDDSYNTEYACTGSLISPEYVLTAAHCLKLGCLPVSSVLFMEPDACDTSRVYGVESFVKFPSTQSGDPDDPGHRYDSLALIKLKQKVDVRDVMPACLHTDREEKLDRKHLTTQGYAAVRDWENVDYKAFAKQLEVWPWKSCQQKLSGIDPLLPKGIVKQQFCAGAGGAGRCIKYSYPGNPGAAVVRAAHAVVLQPDGIEKPVSELIGLEAFSPACGAGLPDVFTAVSHYIPWIESVAWPEEK